MATKPRSVRIPEDLWDQVRQVADMHTRTMTQEITVALRLYVKQELPAPETKRRTPRKAT